MKTLFEKMRDNKQKRLVVWIGRRIEQMDQRRADIDVAIQEAEKDNPYIRELRNAYLLGGQSV